MKKSDIKKYFSKLGKISASKLTAEQRKERARRAYLATKRAKLNYNKKNMTWNTHKNKDVTNPGEPIKTVFFDDKKLTKDKTAEDDLRNAIFDYLKTEVKNHSHCEDDYWVDAVHIIDLVRKYL